MITTLPGPWVGPYIDFRPMSGVLGRVNGNPRLTLDG